MIFPYNYSFLNPVTKQKPFDYTFDPVPEESNPFVRSAQPERQKTLQDYIAESQQQNMPAHSAYAKFLEQGYPDENQFRPNKRTRLASILAGAATGFAEGPSRGIAVGEGIINRPYERAVRRYGLEGQKLKESAGLEENAYGKQIALAQAYAKFENDKATEERLRNSAADLAKTREETRRSSALNRRKTDLEINNFETPEQKSERAIAQSILTASGIAPITRKTQQLNREGQLDNQKSLQTSAFGNAKDLEGIRQVNRLEAQDNASANIEQRAELKAQRDAEKDALKKGLSQGDVKVIRANRTKVESLVNAAPQKYARFWQLGPAGYITITPAPSTEDPLYQDWADLYNSLYEGTNKVNPNPPKVTPKGRVIK